MHSHPPAHRQFSVRQQLARLLGRLGLGFVLALGAWPARAGTPPTITTIADQSLDEDTEVTIPFTIGDLETPVESLSLVVTTDNPSIFIPPGLVMAGTGASRTLTLHPMGNRNGLAHVRVRVTDSDGGTSSTLFAVTVKPVNDPPFITPIGDQSLQEKGSVTIPFRIGDAETPVDKLSLVVTTDGPWMFDPASLILAGSGADRTLTLQPIAHQNGYVHVRVRVTDADGGTASSLFTVTVNSKNESPFITAIPEQQASAGAPTSVVTFTVGDAETPAENLSLEATTDNPALVPLSKIVFAGSGANRTVQITPPADQFGTAHIRVHVNDADGGTNSVVFALRVAPQPLAEVVLAPHVHPGDAWMRARAPLQAGMTYQWSVIPGSSTGAITSGQGLDVIGFSAGSEVGTFQIQVVVTNRLGVSATAQGTVTVERGTWLGKDERAGIPCAIQDFLPLPSGRVLVFPDCSSRPGAMASYDPATGAWRAAASMSGGAAETATLLADGRVLVTHQLSAEIYNPATDRWAEVGAMNASRQQHKAVLLLDGRVLVVGGDLLGRAELFHPATGTWTFTGSTGKSRIHPEALLLPSGKVLVVGGDESLPNTLETYDPKTGVWGPLGQVDRVGLGYSVTLLASGKVLVAGGHASEDPADSCDGYSLARLYDPVADQWTATGSMLSARYLHCAVLLSSGKVLVTGGQPYRHAGAWQYKAELYDPSKGTWSLTGPSRLASGLCKRLSNGTVLAAKTLAGDPGFEVYNPSTAAWALPPSGVPQRDAYSMVRLGDGRLLVSGGSRAPYADAEVYDPMASRWNATGSMVSLRSSHATTLLADGSVLASAGIDLGSAERYDPGTNTWTAAGNLITPRYGHRTTLLNNGRVLVMGGLNNADDRALASSELFDPATGDWTSTGSLALPRLHNSATLLADGRVLVAGGRDEGWGIYASAEIYNPATQAWTATGTLLGKRSEHSATLLPNGKVLVTGGFAAHWGPVASVELYDPATGLWTAMPPMRVPRGAHTATLLPNGKVLLVGDYTDNYDTAEIYDPGTGTSVACSNLNFAVWHHWAMPLNDGSVAIMGGTTLQIYRP